MKGTPPIELGWMALQLLLAIAVIAFFFFRWQANRVRRGLGANADLSFLNPYTWMLRLTHRFKPCACRTGALLLVPRTPLMRSALPNHARYRCGGCGKQLLLNETDAAFFEAARKKERGAVV